MGRSRGDKKKRYERRQQETEIKWQARQEKIVKRAMEDEEMAQDYVANCSPDDEMDEGITQWWAHSNIDSFECQTVDDADETLERLRNRIVKASTLRHEDSSSSSCSSDESEPATRRKRHQEPPRKVRVNLLQVCRHMSDYVQSDDDIYALPFSLDKDSHRAVQRLAQAFHLSVSRQGGSAKKGVAFLNKTKASLVPPFEEQRQLVLALGGDAPTPRNAQRSKTKASQGDRGRKLKPGSERPKRKPRPGIKFESHGVETARDVMTDTEEGYMSPSVMPTMPTQGFAEFEKHTTGIGSRLLAKMGYTGGGLGRDGSGMLTPLAATPRGRRVGLGYDSDA